MFASGRKVKPCCSQNLRLLPPARGWRLSWAGAATSIIFVATNTCLLRQNTSFVATKIRLPHFIFFTTTQNYVCHDKTHFWLRQTRVCHDKTFVATKMILVAAPANDRRHVPPAEDALVGAGQAGCGFHAAMAFYAVECVLVATTSAPQHGLCTTQHNTRK